MSTLALVLPHTGCAPASGYLAALAGHPGRFAALLLHPPGQTPPPGMAGRAVAPAGLPGPAAWRHSHGLAALLRQLRPAVIEVHDGAALAAWLGSRFRPVPVLLVLHRLPDPLPDAADRTLLLALATAVATPDPNIRDRLLAGVHPAMANCTLLPPDPAAAAAALDTLRQDALRAWSRPLHAPI